MRHSIKSAILAVAAAASFAFPASNALAGSPGACAAYAAKAVEQFNKNLNLGCGFGGPRWSADYAGHFSWCLIAETSAANSERNTRDNMLSQCAAPAAPATKIFFNPKIGGVRLDWCRVWANQCGGPAATEYCQGKGYNLAVSWKKDNNIGYSRIITTGQICNQPGCDGFKRVRCSN